MFMVIPMGYPNHKALLASAAFVALANAAHADTIETVVITATRSNTALANVPESVSLITAKDIDTTPVKSLDGVLRKIPSINLPGLESYQLFPNLSTVSMRGLGGSRALVLLDGMPLNDPFFGYVQWNLVPMGDVNRVEVVRGGGAALWGNYAMGGVIDVVTRVPSGDSLSLDAAGGSYGTVRANGFGSLAVSDDVQLGFDAATMRTDGYIDVTPAFHTPLIVPNSFQADTLHATMQFKIDDTFSGDVHAAYHDTGQTLHTPDNTNSQTEWNLSSDLVADLGSSSLTATAFHVYARLRSDNSDTPIGGVAGTNEYVQNRHFTPATSDGASIVWAMTGTDWLRLLSAGVDYQSLHGNDTGFNFSPTGNGAVIRTDIARGSQRFAGVFAQTDIAPLPDLDILASARYQYFENYGGFNGAPGGAGVVPATSTSSFDPRLSVRYDVTSFFSVRAAAYRAFHAPVMNSLYRSFSNRFGIFFSNAALKPETLTGEEAGFDLNFGSVHGQATYYYNEVDDLLTTRPLLPAERPPGFLFGTRNINAGTARAQGAEVSLDWNILQGLDARLGYAYADSVITSNAADHISIGKQLGGVPKQTGSATLGYTGDGGWKVSAEVFWHDKFFNDNDHTLPIGSQFTVGLAASYPIGEHFEPYVQIENLLDERHIASNAGTSAPELETPFTVLVGLRVKVD
jgi:outer membrane receptor protein involved in Fe transport